MKLIELTRRPVEMSGVQRVIDQVNRMLPFVKSGEHAEDAIIARCMRKFDNRFIVVRNLPVEGTEDYFPPILIGPAGVMVMNISPLQGSFRAKDDAWLELSKSTQRYNPGHPNLIKQSQDFAQKLVYQLDQHQKTHPEIVPILIFANPGVQVETVNPAVRIVHMDGVENLIAAILKSEEAISPNEVDLLADALEIMGNPEKAIPLGEGEDFFGRDLLDPEKKDSFSLRKVKLPTKIALPPIEEKLNFSPKQWLIIEILMVSLILVLIGAIVYILLAF
jgi:hypothetical protein